MNPYIILGAVLAIACAFGGGMATNGYMRDAKENRELVEAQAAAIAIKEAWDKDIATQRQKAQDEKAVIAADRDAALERLRNRPPRLSEASRAACKGSTGGELSGLDSGFLIREAARADELRTALKECQAWVDTVTGHQP